MSVISAKEVRRATNSLKIGKHGGHYKHMVLLSVTDS